jgi:cellulose synthase/poly-beta-1,6-N-acetylglucosamine synthase-like glycosyltransferase
MASLSHNCNLLCIEYQDVMELFPGFKLSITELIAALVLILSFAFQLYFYFRYLNITFRMKNKERKGRLSFQQEKLPVSVIICARDETENLRKFLPEILKQDYPDFEVIVVNDGGNEDTEILLREMKKEYPVLRSTFVPDGTTNLSTKKLALTLGIKAAKNEWLLFTDADCIPEGNQWISRMARNFSRDAGFVLGYGAYLSEKGFLNRLITYDTLFNALQYLGFAAAGIPYMGVGRNMAYRKEIFFREKGFASTLHLRSGDDDLMVNQFAGKKNTRIETSVESITWSPAEKTFSRWYYQKERHLSVSTYYRSASKLQLIAEPLSRGLFYLAGLVILLQGIIAFNWVLIAIPFTFFLLKMLVLGIIINRSSHYYGGRNYLLLLPVFDIILPLLSAFIMTFGRMGKKAVNISWK